jgi:hypothetical protein
LNVFIQSDNLAVQLSFSSRLSLPCCFFIRQANAMVLRDFKKFTSSNIIKAIENNTRESRKNWMLWIFKKAGEKNERNKNYQFWQQENHPIECSTYEVLQSKIKYVHENPLRSGLVRNESDYVYSSGVDYYANEKGLIEINFLN